MTITAITTPIVLPDQNDDVEPVLVVPRRLTQSANATLLAHNCVGRKWHLESRYGSRTFAVGNDRMGLPLLPQMARKILATITHSVDKNLWGPDLQELMATEQVEIMYMPVPTPKFVDKLETIDDATMHADRKPVFLPMKLRNELLERKSDHLFTFVDLFCGIGGFAVALEAMGGKCVLASEIDEPCRDIYLENTNCSMQCCYGDIYNIPESALPKNVDLVVGGFPCQPFSSLGKQPGFSDGTRGLLYTQIVRVLEAVQPNAFLLENVPGLMEMRQSLETIVSALEGAGYNVSVEVCSARGLTAQARKRLFFVGLRKENKNAQNKQFQFPFIPDLGLRARDVIDYCVGEQDGKNTDKYEFYRVTDSQMDQLLNRSKRWKPARLAWEDKVCDTIDGHYGVTIGKGNSQLVPCVAPNHPRCFTTRECARLMGFPSSFRIPSEPKEGQGARAHLKKQYLMFGNAVCPPLIAVLAGAVLEESSGINGFDRNNNWRAKGLEVGIHIALDCVTPPRREAVCERLRRSGILE